MKSNSQIKFIAIFVFLSAVTCTNLHSHQSSVETPIVFTEAAAHAILANSGLLSQDNADEDPKTDLPDAGAKEQGTTTPKKDLIDSLNSINLANSMFTEPASNEKCIPKTKKFTNSTMVDIAKFFMKNIPFKKENAWEKKKYGCGNSAYLFDYLDPVMLRAVTDEFEDVYQKALKLSREDRSYQDPYCVAPGQFDPESWNKGISAVQIHKILKEWRWNFRGRQTDPARELLDMYDFDGNGRLSPREFILLVIRTNKRTYDSFLPDEKSCINCLKKIVTEYIDPMFSYFDVCGETSVSAEDIWKSLKYLNRQGNKNYDIYQCKLSNGQYHTSAVNDFLLKSQKKTEGRLSKSEFRQGILYGYWNRQTSDKKILTIADDKNHASTVTRENSRSLKHMRWLNNGAEDKLCIELQNIIPKKKA